MQRFIARHSERISGVLSGFDRLIFRGCLRAIAYRDGLAAFMSRHHVLLKDFGPWAESLTAEVKTASLKEAHRLGRPVLYLASAKTDKEQVALDIARRDGIQQGLIAVLTSVETCWSFDIHRNREAKRLELVPAVRKCLHYYHYLIDPVLGFMNARIQTWLPFRVQVCINGREWLARHMDRRGMAYERRDNCFARVEDLPAAQRLLRRQLETSWPRTLSRILRTLNPEHRRMFATDGVDYYWSVYQSEWATDVMFQDSASLAVIYPSLVRHAMLSFQSRDVMRFLGRQITGTFRGQVITSLKGRPEGVRIKHSINANSIKLYDKQGCVLRAETTLNNPSEFKVYRPPEDDPDGRLEWRRLRWGVADLHRRAQICQAANERYLDALAAVEPSQTLEQLLARIVRPVTHDGYRARGIRPWAADDAPLLEAIIRGEFQLNGFRNRDLRRVLFGPDPQVKATTRSRSARVTRLLRLLRAHGLIRKVPRSHRYLVSPLGAAIIPPILAARRASVRQLQSIAA